MKLRRLGLTLVLVTLAVVGIGLSACGGDDDTDGAVDTDGAADDAATVGQKIEAAGFQVEEASADELPSIVSEIPTEPDSGFETALIVTGPGLRPGSDFSGAVFVFLYASSEDAAQVLADEGGEGDSRTARDNQLYTWGSGIVAEPLVPPEFQEVVEAAGG